MYSRGLIAGLVVLVVCSLIFSSAWSWTSSSAFYRSARHKRKTVRQHSTLSFIGTGGSNDIEIITSSSNGKMGQPIDQLYSNIPPPLNNLVDINMERSSVVYEVNLNRDIGFEIVQGFDYAVVGQVLTNSKAEKLGIRTGDIIAATSATAGDQMWAHDSAESVRSALSTRFVMSATVKMRLERSLQSIPEEIISDLRIPYYTVVKLKRPIGLHVTEGPGKTVFVQGIKPNLGAARSRRVEIGDQIIAMSASWGDRMWDVNSVDSFVVGVKMRRDPQLSFKLKRMVPFDVFTGQVADKKQKDLREPQLQGKSTAISQQLAKISITDTSSEKGSSHSLTPCVQINRMLDSARSSNDLAEIVNFLLKNQHVRLTAYLINKIMTMCLRKELPDLAIKLFENSFNFHLSDPNPALSALHLFDDDIEDSEIAWSQISAKSHKFDSLIDLEGQVVADDVVLRDDDDDDDDEVYDNDDEEIEASVTLDTNRGFVAESRRSPSRLSSSDDAYRPNNFVCTTAVKAYGRKMQVEKALALLPWMEMQGEKADVYFMSSLLYVCAKCKRVDDAERLFWKDIPRRKLSYTVATTNSLMYMYAKLNRPDDALRVYELTKDIGLKCTVVTYGVLIKALMRSGKPSFHQKAFEVVKTLPNIGIQPGIEVYNQILEYYSSTQNYRKTKAVLRMMAQVKPRVKPDAVTYGYLIACFADSKKPRSALTAFHQMMKKGIPPSSYTYMGVLKALAHMRDGLSAVQVIQEMIDVGISPDEKHFSMAMFACVIANQGSLAESIISLYIKRGGRPDTALCTLWLRALLQQGKWTAGLDLLHRMTKGKEFAKPNIQTYNYLLQYQILAGKLDDASNTFNLILKKYKSHGGPGYQLSLQGTFMSLSFAMGMYSGHLVRLYREDYSSMQYSPSNLPTSLIEPGESMDDNLKEGEVALTENVPVSGAGGAASTGSFGGGALYLEGSLKKPTAEGLQFLLVLLEEIGRMNIVIPGEFYLDFLKALVLEGFPTLAKRLLNLREENMVRLKSEDQGKLEHIEQLALRAIKGGLIKNSAEKN